MVELEASGVGRRSCSPTLAVQAPFAPTRMGARLGDSPSKGTFVGPPPWVRTRTGQPASANVPRLGLWQAQASSFISLRRAAPPWSCRVRMQIARPLGIHRVQCCRGSRAHSGSIGCSVVAVRAPTRDPSGAMLSRFVWNRRVAVSRRRTPPCCAPQDRSASRCSPPPYEGPSAFAVRACAQIVGWW
jgi:hypothetical protein